MFGKKNKLSNEESSDLLESFLPYYSLPDFTLINILETIANSDIESQKIRNICNQIIYGIVEENQKTEDIFLTVGLIKDNEYSIMANSDKTEKAIEDILTIRKINWRFEYSILKIIWFPWLLILLTFGSLGFLYPLLVEGLKKQILQLNNKVDIYNTLPWFMQNSLTFKIITLIIFLLPFIIFGIYLYVYYKDTKKIYKLFKLKAYDDLPKYFTIMISLRNTGASLRNIMNELYQYANPQPMGQLWYFIEENGDMGKGFRLFNMPDDITKIVIRFTETNAIYDTLEHLKELSIKRFNLIIKRIEIYGDMIGKLFWFIPIYFLTQTIMWIMALFSQISSNTTFM